MEATFPLSSWEVHKFGGSSLFDAACFNRVSDIVKQNHAKAENRQLIVVSAMGGITDQLIKMTQFAEKNDEVQARECLQVAFARHSTLAEQLFGADSELGRSYLSIVTEDIEGLHSVIKTCCLSSSCSSLLKEFSCSFGELWSAQAMYRCLKLKCPDAHVEWLNARDVLRVIESGVTAVTDDAPPVHWESSRANVQSWNEKQDQKLSILVVTGFIARRTDGTPTTLKRDGSDYSASIFANLFDAKQVTIWTDVNGVYSVDPRRVPTAWLLPELSYTEAIEFSFYGASIVHPKTMAPAVNKAIPIFIRSTFNQDCAGTKISQASNRKDSRAVTGLCCMDRISLVTVKVSLIHTAEYVPMSLRNHLLHSLRNVRVPLVMMSQASPEHSVAFCVPEVSAEIACAAIEQSMRQESAHYKDHEVILLKNYAVVTAVGDHINHLPGVAGRFFTALGRAKVNVMGIAQNGERIISVLMESKDATTALAALHAEFLDVHRHVSLGIFLASPQQLSSYSSLINASSPGVIPRETDHIGQTVMLDLRGIANVTASKFVIGLNIQTNSAIEHLEKGIQHVVHSTSVINTSHGYVKSGLSAVSSVAKGEVTLESFLRHIHTVSTSETIVLDIDNNAELIHTYLELIRRGVHLVTANLNAVSCNDETYSELKSALNESNSTFDFSSCLDLFGLSLSSIIQSTVVETLADWAKLELFIRHVPQAEAVQEAQQLRLKLRVIARMCHIDTPVMKDLTIPNKQSEIVSIRGNINIQDRICTIEICNEQETANRSFNYIFTSSVDGATISGTTALSNPMVNKDYLVSLSALKRVSKMVTQPKTIKEFQ